MSRFSHFFQGQENSVDAATKQPRNISIKYTYMLSMHVCIYVVVTGVTGEMAQCLHL
jgi:hypothetical protein